MPSLRRPPERAPGHSRHREERAGSHGGVARSRRLSSPPPPPPPRSPPPLPPDAMSNPGTRRNGSSIKIRLTGNGAAAAPCVCGRTSTAGPGVPSPPLAPSPPPRPGCEGRGGRARAPASLNFYSAVFLFLFYRCSPAEPHCAFVYLYFFPPLRRGVLEPPWGGINLRRAGGLSLFCPPRSPAGQGTFLLPGVFPAPSPMEGDSHHPLQHPDPKRGPFCTFPAGESLLITLPCILPICGVSSAPSQCGGSL